MPRNVRRRFEGYAPPPYVTEPLKVALAHRRRDTVGAHSSAAERRLCKAEAEGSNPSGSMNRTLVHRNEPSRMAPQVESERSRCTIP